MKTKSRLLFFRLLVMILVSSCAPNAKKADAGNNQTTSDSLVKNDTTIDKDGGIPIFYNMYLSVEMSSLFQNIGVTFNQKNLNSPDKIEIYNLSTDKAMNLGVYAVDLSYAKYFEQFELAGKYLQAMHKLCNDLGIPDEKFYLSIKRIETNLANKDSLIKIANELYNNAENFLKKNERESAAAMIILGGWTEALFIATKLLTKNPKDLDLVERIAEQKHSLNDLIDLLKKYEKEKLVKIYLDKLYNLKLSFAKLQVDSKNLNLTFVQLDEISAKISNLRNEIVN
jgi:hypothetical protein